MARRIEYIINGPPAESAQQLPVRVQGSPSIRRDPKNNTNLRSQYYGTVTLSQPGHDDSSHDGSRAGALATNLPPTPPGADDEHHEHELCSCDGTSLAESNKPRSATITPVNQFSPPTPDHTPPRNATLEAVHAHLAAPPSLRSIRAESFKTARENVNSDNESETSLSTPPNARSRLTHGDRPKASPLSLTTVAKADQEHRSSPLVQASPVQTSCEMGSPVLASTTAAGLQPDHEPIEKVSEQIDTRVADNVDASFVSPRDDNTPIDVDGAKHRSPVQRHSLRKDTPLRGFSLRERIEGAKNIRSTASTDKFASIIGWNSEVQPSMEHDHRRWSGPSTSSTVEAFVVDSPVSRKRGTLRHIRKNESLRSVSSPIPRSNRTSLQSSSDSPHRLVHKKGKVTNRQRWSFGSEVSHAPSATSTTTHSKPEIIKVAVIPERDSSLQSSAAGSVKHQRSRSLDAAPSRSGQSRRATSENAERGRDRRYPPQVPARASSLSAPTSRSTSRANSITSEQFRAQRQQAEKDLRKTLDRMESERLVASLHSVSRESAPLATSGAESAGTSLAPEGHVPKHGSSSLRKGSFLSSATSGGDVVHDPFGSGNLGADELQPPPSLRATPFSQHTFASASPEIVEAKVVSLFLHNNESVQLIEQNRLSESLAVQMLRLEDSPQFRVVDTIDASTPPVHTDDRSKPTDSPLRNPRDAPEPPPVQVFPFNPAAYKQPTETNTPPVHKRVGSLKKRPLLNDRARSESFAKAVVRNFSTKRVRNPKADQYLDSDLHPFWRPKAFWDDLDPEQRVRAQARALGNEGGERGGDDFVVHRSAGVPPQRSVTFGPVALIRRFSQRRRTDKQLAKQSSYSSLQRLKAGRKLYRTPTFGINMYLTKAKHVQDRVMTAKTRREEDKREKRREALRRSIGANVVSMSDSRFPSTNNNRHVNEPALDRGSHLSMDDEYSHQFAIGRNVY